MFLQEQDRPELAVSGQAAPGTTSNALLQGLLRVPDLATAEDREQSAGIVSLAALVQVCAPKMNSLIHALAQWLLVGSLLQPFWRTMQW